MQPTNFKQNTSPHHLFSYSKFLLNCIQISKWQALFRMWQPLGSTFHPTMTRILNRMFCGSELAVTPRNCRFTERLQGQHDTLYGLSTHRGQIRTIKNTGHTPCMIGDINQRFLWKTMCIFSRNNSLPAGRPGDRISVGRALFSAPIQTGSGAHPVSSTIGHYRGRAPGAWHRPLTPPSAEVKE